MLADAPNPPDRLAESYAALGVRPFEPPPAGFDPLRAATHDLLAYGYPDRPDPVGQTELYRWWVRMVSPPLRLIRPEFAVLPEPVRSAVPTNTDRWAGSVVVLSGGESVRAVQGQWTVPRPYPAGLGRQEVTIWLGMDGGRDRPPADPGRIELEAPGALDGEIVAQILQAGTTVGMVEPDSPYVFYGTPTRFSWVWWAWRPDPPVAITNFPVSEGDVICCWIRMESATEAEFFLTNQNEGCAVFFTKTAPDGVELTGSRAEWIVERPMGPLSLDHTRLARFDAVYIDGCAAEKRDYEWVGAGDGVLLTTAHVFPVLENDVLLKLEQV